MREAGRVAVVVVQGGAGHLARCKSKASGTQPVRASHARCAAELLELQARLVGAFPDMTDLSHDPARGIARFTPHLSLGQFRSLADLEAAKQASRRGRVGGGLSEAQCI